MSERQNMVVGQGKNSLLHDPVERRPRRRIDLAAIVIGLMIALTPEPSNAVLVGVLAGAVLLTLKWIWRRWRRSGQWETAP